jgi:hypothetical protein
METMSRFVMWLGIGPAIYVLPALPAALAIRRRMPGLSTAVVLMLSVLLSMAAVPLLLFDVAWAVPLGRPAAFQAILAAWTLISVALLLLRRATPSDVAGRPSSVFPPAVYGCALATVVLVLLPFLRYGWQRDGQVIFPCIFDWHFEMGYTNGIAAFGLPCPKMFAKGADPSAYHIFFMIFKALPVLLTGHLLTPLVSTWIGSAVVSLLFVLTVAFLLGRRSTPRAVTLVLLLMLFCASFDIFPTILYNVVGVPKEMAAHPDLAIHAGLHDPMLRSYHFMTDSWMRLDYLRIFSPLAQLIWQPRHVVPVLFFFSILWIMDRREAAPCGLGLLAGVLGGAIPGYSIPIALNSAVVVPVLFGYLAWVDFRSGRAGIFLRFAACAGMAALALGLPFALPNLASTSGGTSVLVLRFPEARTLGAVFLIDYGPLMWLALPGLWMWLRKGPRTGLDRLVFLAGVVTFLLMLTVRMQGFTGANHNEFGMKTSLVVWIALAYFAAYFVDSRAAASAGAAPMLTGKRFAAYGVAWLMVLAPTLLLPISRVPLLVCSAVIVLAELLLRKGILAENWRGVALGGLLFMGALNFTYDVVGHNRGNLAMPASLANALEWVRTNTPRDATVQILPVDRWSVASIAGRRTYLSSAVAEVQGGAYRDHLEALNACVASPSPASPLRRLGIDFIVAGDLEWCRRALAAGGLRPAFSNGTYEVLEVR